jgi:NADPH:quinone reductase
MAKQKAYLIENINGKNNFEQRQINIPTPKENEVLIRHTYLGLNYIDYEYYSSKIELPKNPLIPGIEAVGRIEKIGSNVTDFKINQRVAYGTVFGGAFCEYRTINKDLIIPIPEEIEDCAVAAFLTKGMTAHYLLRRTFFVRPEMTVFISNASSTVGQLMMKLCKKYNAKVIAGITSESRIEDVKSLGAAAIVNVSEQNFYEEILEKTNGKGVNVAYDCLGGDMLNNLAKCAMNFGLLVNFGAIISKPNVIDPSLLNQKSLFLTSTKLQNYKQNNKELILSGIEVCGLIHENTFENKAKKVYNFDEVEIAIKKIGERTNFRPSVIKV